MLDLWPIPKFLLLTSKMPSIHYITIDVVNPKTVAFLLSNGNLGKLPLQLRS